MYVKSHLILGILLVMAVLNIVEVQATGDSTQVQPKDEPNYDPKITKDPTNEKIEIIEFNCKLK